MMISNDSIKQILILAANPKGTDKLRLDEEARDIKEGLRRSKDRERFIIDSEWAVRSRDIRRAILQYKPQIIHFSGHGAECGGLVFEDETGQSQLVQPDALAGLFKLLSKYLECVVLNACYSEIQADAIAQHIDFVIGVSKEISDGAAIEFSVGFYDALGAGCSLETAYEFGCNAIQMAGFSEHSTPVLKWKYRPTQLIQDITILPDLSYMKDSLAKPSGSENHSSKTIRYEFVLTGNINEISKPKLKAIVAHLREITGDTSLTLLEIETGSVKLVLESSENSFRLLKALIKSGELKQVLGVPVQYIEKRELQVYSIEKNSHSISEYKDLSEKLDPLENEKAISGNHSVFSSRPTVVTMLGSSGSGKTCYLSAMYAVLSTGLNGYSLHADEQSDARELIDIWSKMLKHKDAGKDRFPQSTSVTNQYNFRLNYGFSRSVIEFDWLEYNGGMLSDSSEISDRQYLVERLKKTDCLILFISGEYFAQKVTSQYRLEIAVETEIAHINQLMAETKRHIHNVNDVPPSVAIVISKYDFCHQRSEDLSEEVKELFPVLFESPGWLVMTCPVTLGLGLANDINSPLEPINLHIPLLFSLLTQMIRIQWKKVDRDILNIQADRNPNYDLKFSGIRDIFRKVLMQSAKSNMQELDEVERFKDEISRLSSLLSNEGEEFNIYLSGEKLSWNEVLE